VEQFFGAFFWNNFLERFLELEIFGTIFWARKKLEIFEKNWENLVDFGGWFCLVDNW